MIGYLIKHVLNGLGRGYTKYIIITDTIPIKKLRGKLEQSIKNVLKQDAPIGITYNILHHSSKSNLGLQIVDYCNWAIYRKWSTGDRRSYDLIKDGIKSEWDLFSSATKYYY